MVIQTKDRRMPGYRKYVRCRKCMVWVERSHLRPGQNRCDVCNHIFSIKPKGSKYKEKYIAEGSRY